MSEWIANLQSVLQFALGNPNSKMEMGVLAALAFLLLWVILGKAGGLLGINNTRPVQTIIVAVIGLLLSFVALAAVQIYLPDFNNPPYRLWVLIGVPVAVGLFLVAPFMCLFQKAMYISAVMTWALGVAGAAMVVLLVGSMFDSFVHGSRGADKGKAHRQEIEQIQRE